MKTPLSLVATANPHITPHKRPQAQAFPIDGLPENKNEQEPHHTDRDIQAGQVGVEEKRGMDSNARAANKPAAFP